MLLPRARIGFFGVARHLLNPLPIISRNQMSSKSTPDTIFEVALSKLPILYEDHDIIVVNKPSEMLSVCSRDEAEDAIVELVKSKAAASSSQVEKLSV